MQAIILTPMGGIVTRLAARKVRKQGTKVYYTAHGFHFYKGAPKKNWIVYYPIEKFFARYTDKLITITDEDYKLASKHFPCKVERIHGVGADTTKFTILDETERKAIKNELGISPETKIILNVGELLPNKNQKTAIAAMRQVIDQVPDCLLFIAGNVFEYDNLKSMIESNKRE